VYFFGKDPGIVQKVQALLDMLEKKRGPQNKRTMRLLKGAGSVRYVQRNLKKALTGGGGGNLCEDKLCNPGKEKAKNCQGKNSLIKGEDFRI